MSDQAAIAQDLLLKRELIDDILASPDGQVKQASLVTSKATRTQIREEGFQRVVLPFEDITNDDLDYFGDSELPGVWFELEPDSPPARTIPYNATPNTFAYSAQKYVVLISTITTEEATKNVNELRTYKTDIRQIVSDNMLRDIHTEEDSSFMVGINRIVGSAENLSAAPSVECQNVVMGGGVSRLTIKRAQSFLTDRHVPIGIFLVNQRTANEFLGWHRDEAGGDLSGELLKKGLKALDKFEIFGSPYVSTIKNFLVPNGYMYQFAPKEWIGHALRLEDITVTIKKEYDVIRMRAQEQVGLTIGNTRGIQKLKFEIGN